MLDFLMNEPQRVVAVEDNAVSAATMEEALRSSSVSVGSFSSCFWGSRDTDEFAEQLLHIERKGPEAEPPAPDLAGMVGDATVIMSHVSPVPRSIIEQAPNLRAIFSCRGGLENIDIDAASEHGVAVVNVIRNAIPVAEYALGMIIALTRNIGESHRALMAGEWRKSYPNSAFTSTLGNLTVGLAGMGNIGIEVATRLKALGVPMIAHDDYLDRERLDRNGLSDVEMTSTLEELFERADVVSLHLRLTPETEHMIDKRYFSRMKPTAYFVNTARGGLVNQEDLLDVLRRHAIAGAALDVFDEEPLEATSGFQELDNVLVTSHLAGATVDAIPRAPHLLMREVEKILHQGTVERIVNRQSLGL